MKTGGEQQHRNDAEFRKGGMEDTHQLQAQITGKGPSWSADTYPAGAAALTFGEEQRGTLQNRPRRGPILPGDQKKQHI